MNQKELKITQTVLGQDVQISISLDKNNFINVEKFHQEKFKDNVFQFIIENFYSITSDVTMRFTLSAGGDVFCYGPEGVSPHKFYFIFDGHKYCFTFCISNKGNILINYENHKTVNLESKFNELIQNLKFYSDKNYYYYFSQKLNEIYKSK